MAIDLEAIAELDSGAVDDWLELGLAREQLQLSQVMAVQKSRSKATSTILVDRPFNSFCSTEKSLTPLADGTAPSPSRMAEPASICEASDAIFRKRLVQSFLR